MEAQTLYEKLWSSHVVHQETDERFWLGVDASRDNRWVQLAAASKTTTQVWLLDATDPASGLRALTGRREGVEYDVEVTDVTGGDDRCFVSASVPSDPAMQSIPKLMHPCAGHDPVTTRVA